MRPLKASLYNGVTILRDAMPNRSSELGLTLTRWAMALLCGLAPVSLACMATLKSQPSVAARPLATLTDVYEVPGAGIGSGLKQGS